MFVFVVLFSSFSHLMLHRFTCNFFSTYCVCVSLLFFFFCFHLVTHLVRFPLLFSFVRFNKCLQNPQLSIHCSLLLLCLNLFVYLFLFFDNVSPVLLFSLCMRFSMCVCFCFLFSSKGFGLCVRVLFLCFSS